MESKLNILFSAKDDFFQRTTIITYNVPYPSDTEVIEQELQMIIKLQCGLI